MPPEDSEAGGPADWLRYARSDLAYAKVPRPPGVLWESLCFHAQQAAEKAIKAVLVASSIAFPRTHNLETLVELLPHELPTPIEPLKAVGLSHYAAVTRYPGEFESIGEAEYIEAITLASAVVAWAEATITGASHY